MVKEIVIDYDPSYEINSEKHDALERVVDKYNILTIGSDKKSWTGKLLLLLPGGLKLEKLTDELKPIRILHSA